MKRPLVSIGISFYRDVTTLSDTIDSIVAQTYDNWELILVDDGSSDGSLEVAKRYIGEKVRLFSDGENKGLARRLNEMVNCARGKYFARMDADDIMHPERIKRQVEFLENNIDIDVVGTNAYSLGMHNEILGIRKSHEIPKDYVGVFKNTVFIHPTVMGKTAWFRRNPYEESAFAHRAEDYELWCRSYQHSRFAYIDQPLLFYREAASITKNRKNYSDSCDSVIRIIDKLGKGRIRSWDRMRLTVNYSIKKIIVIMMARCGIFPDLVSQRYMRLSDEEGRKAHRTLTNIIGNSVEKNLR